MKRIRLVLAPALIAFLISNAQATDSKSRYQSWQPPAGDVVQPSAQQNESTPMQKMIDDLNKLIDDADKARAADRNFIEDLRDVVNQYDWPWRKTVLEEDFTDGRLQNKSKWQITSGDFQLKRGLGLHSNITRQQTNTQPTNKRSDKEVAAALFGALINQAMKTDNQTTSTSTSQLTAPASIIGKAAIPNAFAIKLDIDVRSQQGKIEIGVYQGNHKGTGYRLVFLPGPSASIEIQRIGSRGKSIIDVADNINAKGDSIHHLQWTRNKQGNMKVLLNDKTILQLADRSFKDKFNGVIINNESGEFALQRLTIQGD